MKRLLAIVPVVAMAAYGSSSQATPKNETAMPTPAHADTPAVDGRHALLDLAFSAVGKMPEDPHLKTKARSQYKVVGCALELGAPKWAETYADQVVYWEQGASYADIAIYYAEHGDVSAANTQLLRAEKWLEKHEPKFKESATEQAWRLDRIRSKIAQAAIMLDNQDVAQKYRKDLDQGDAAEVVRREALQCAGKDPKSALARIDKLAKTGAFADISSATEGLVDLYDLQYTNETVRKAIAERVADFASTNTPFAFQIKMITRMGEAALKHGDAAVALSDAAKGRKLLEAHPCAPRFYIPMAARLAALRCQAGEKKEGLNELAACLQLFEKKNTMILNIDQAGILCSLAEADHKVGDDAKAMTFYSRAIVAGQVNPNSRPRVEDLCRICCSMVRSGVVSSGELLQKLQKMDNGLGKPW